MMLTGKNVYATSALKMGLVDKLVDQKDLHGEASKFALKLANGASRKTRNRSLMDKILEGPLKGIVFKKARQKVLQQTQGNYPAPMEIIACVEAGMRDGVEEGLSAEAERFETLILSNESRQLINIFFGMNEKKKNPMKQLARNIDKIGMVGAGFMGAGIAEVSVMDGIDVILKDIKQEVIDSAKGIVQKDFDRKVKRKAITKSEADGMMSKITGQLDFTGFKDLDIVIEAVFEDLDIKKKVLAECEANTREDCIFATNTSALPISLIAENSARPELIIGMHYFSPVPKMPLLEIVVYDKTADWVKATAYELGVRQGKTVIVVNDGPGFYTSRILAPFMNEALLMLEEGGDILQIDKQVKKFGFPVGPVTLLDEVGIDVAAHVITGRINVHFEKEREGAISGGTGIVKMFENGYSGRKNKKGFYKYDSKTGKKLRGQVNEEAYAYFGGKNRSRLDNEEIQYRAGLAMVNEAAYCLQEGIISDPLDGDIGAIFGLGFPPFRGGPFRYLDYEGLGKIIGVLESLAQKHTARFKPAPILYDYEKQGKKFYP